MNVDYGRHVCGYWSRFLSSVNAMCRAGDELRVYDGRPNGEMVLATGSMERDNPADHLTMQARLPPNPASFDASRTPGHRPIPHLTQHSH